VLDAAQGVLALAGIYAALFFNLFFAFVLIFLNVIPILDKNHKKETKKTSVFHFNQIIAVYFKYVRHQNHSNVLFHKSIVLFIIKLIKHAVISYYNERKKPEDKYNAILHANECTFLKGL